MTYYSNFGAADPLYHPYQAISIGNALLIGLLG